MIASYVLIGLSLVILVTIAAAVFKPSISIPSIRLTWSARVWTWLLGIVFVSALVTFGYLGQWSAFWICVAAGLLIFAAIKAPSWVAGIFGSFFALGLMIAGLMLLHHHLSKDGPPPPSATDPTRFYYTLTVKSGGADGKRVDGATLVEITESSTAAITFRYTENSGSKCVFSQRLGAVAETGQWSGPQNGKGTFKVTEFIPGKVSKVSGMMWYEKSGYHVPTGEDRIYYFTLDPRGHK